jgi:hypothetical protein
MLMLRSGFCQNSPGAVVADPTTTKLASGIPVNPDSGSTSTTHAPLQSGNPAGDPASTTTLAQVQPNPSGNPVIPDSGSTTTRVMPVASGNPVIPDSGSSSSSTTSAQLASGNPVNPGGTSTTSQVPVAVVSGNPVAAGPSSTTKSPAAVNSDLPAAATASSTTQQRLPASGQPANGASSTTTMNIIHTVLPGNGASSTTIKIPPGTNIQPGNGASSTTIKAVPPTSNLPPGNGGTTTTKAAPAASAGLPQGSTTTRQVINTVQDLPSTTSNPGFIRTAADVFVQNTPTPKVNTVRYVISTVVPTPSELGLDIYHCQLMLINDYDMTLNISGWQAELYANRLAPVLATAVAINDARITDVSVLKHPDTDGLVLKFDVRPPLSTCVRDCIISSRSVVDTIRSRTAALNFNLTDKSWPTPQILYPIAPPSTSFYSWTDKGSCPNATDQSSNQSMDACNDKSICSIQLTGQFYCKCLDVNDCPTSSFTVVQKSKSNQKLWALIVIPIVLIIVLIVVLAVLIHLRLIKLPVKRKLGPTVRNYKPAYDIGTIVDQPMTATLDPGAANKLYRTMSSTLGVAFHGKAFQDNNSDSSSGVDSAPGTPFGGP